MDDEKRMIENYEVRHSVYLGDREIVFAIDKDVAMPYLVSNCYAAQTKTAEIIDYDRSDELEVEDKSIEADPAVRNFSYTIVDNQIYYRENSRMNPVEVSKTAESWIRGMIQLRDCVRTLLEYQTEDYPEGEIKAQQAKLNALYDRFTKDYGLINSRGNAIAFDQDSSYFLLCSLEIVGENGELLRKADLFTKRTIRCHRPAEKVDTAVEALALSIGEKARVDMDYMGQLTGKSEEQLFSDLTGVVFLNPDYAEGEREKYLPADEYLSGNVRQKLVQARELAANDPQFKVNADALMQVQPMDLTASEISVRLGATWLNPDYYRRFTFETLSPEGTGYRAKTRFAKFYNLPELMSMLKNVADIQTADMLKLPVPEAHYHNVALKPSDYQKDMVASLAERAERVRNREVDSSVDNILLITNDGRKLALDQRLVNPMLPDNPDSKAAKCAETVFEIWQRTAAQRSAQMVFCDLSTPKGNGTFSVYDNIRDKLLKLGIPEREIAFIHNAKSETQKKDLFAQVRSGQVRVLLGSTQRMGAGTNVQQKLIALHHVDCPWRPSDLQQREGRIIRQGNQNPEVDIYSYVTEGTLDAYLYQLVESKQKFISQIMTSKSPVRSAEDVDETALSYAEIKALASGNPMIKEKMDLDIEVSRLKLLKSSHLSQRYALEDAISKGFPREITEQRARLSGYGADIATVMNSTQLGVDGFSPMALAGTTYAEKKEAGAALLALCQNMLSPEPVQIGSYRGLTLELSFDSFAQEYRLTMIGQLRHMVALGMDVFGNLQRMENLLETLPVKEQTCRERLGDLQTQLETARTEVQQPFVRENELKTKTARLEELNALLNMDNKEPPGLEQTEKPKEKEIER